MTDSGAHGARTTRRDQAATATRATHEMTTDGAPPDHKTDNRERVISLLQTVVFDIGLSVLLFHYARDHGASEVAAYMWSMIGPAVSIAVELIRHRQFSHFSTFILSIQVISILVTFIGSTDPKVLLLKDSVLTGAIGLVFLGSLLFGKPLTYHFGLKFGTDGTPEAAAEWEGLWERYPAFRATQRQVAALWGVGFLVEALLRVIAVETLSFDQAFNVGAVLPMVVVAILVALTFWLGMRSRKRGEARRAAAEAAARDTNPPAERASAGDPLPDLGN